MQEITKYRQLIHYSLIASTLLIHIIILIFFYNEYFNGKKLSAIEDQLNETRQLKTLTDHSRKELLLALEHLQKYIAGNEREHIEAYFLSLRNLIGNIDSIKVYESINPELKAIIDQKRDDISNLSRVESLIDSIYKESQKPLLKENPLKVWSLDFKDPIEKVDIEIKHSADSITSKKGLFPRLRDAFMGHVDVIRDTIFVNIRYGNSMDTNKVKADFDSIVEAINKHYQREIRNYQSHLLVADSKNSNIYHIYDNLIILSNNLMEIYDSTISDFNDKLEQQYNKQISINNKIREYTIFVLMLVMLFVLIVIMYYTKQSFLYERRLRQANLEIRLNLNFKNRILGMLSHEVRAPLKIINLFINRIQKKTKDESIKESLKPIHFTTNSLLIQANQILEYAKNQERPIELKPITFNLRTEIESILEIFHPYFESRKNTLEIKNEIAENLSVYADNIKIHQIFTNIFGNANKFTENGKISVDLKTESLNELQIVLNVEIADTGIGISESDIEKIFEPYYQGIISDELDNLGAGLGLNLCKEIIELFGGSITVKSKLGEGSCINFELPLKLEPVPKP